MSPEKKVAIVTAAIGLMVLIAIIVRYLPRRMKTKKFIKRWRVLQSKCADEAKWLDVLKEADQLLDEALRRRRIKGKTTGERMVQAGDLFTDKDAVWFGHKLRKKFEANPQAKPSKEQMKKALVGLLQALKDLGAIK